MTTNDPPGHSEGAQGGQETSSWNPYLVAGGVAVLFGLLRRSKMSLVMLAAGASLVYRGRTGRWPFSTNGAGPQTLRGTVTINRPAEELYRLWTDLERLPEYLPHIESIGKANGDRSRWVARAPMDRQLAWEAEVIETEPNQRIAWRSLSGSPLPMSGSVSFHEPSGARGTELSVKVQYEPPHVPLGGVLTRSLSKIPQHQLRTDLVRLKQRLEAGEAPTTEGQPRGPLRSATERRSNP